MIRTSILGVMALGAALTLSACSSKGEGQGFLIGSAGKQVFASLKAQRENKGPQPVVQITPKQLANTKVAALQVNPLDRGGSDFLRRVTQRNDSTRGTVSVWRASDGAQLIVRNGVLVGSRGIGADILSSDAGPTIAALAGARGGQGERRYFVSNGDYTSTEITLSCDIVNLGPEDTQVVNFSYKTVHLRETCVGGTDGRIEIVNDYWVQPGSGTVRRSHQWAGPLSGHFELILLKS